MNLVLGRGRNRKTFEIPHATQLKAWSNVDYNKLRDALCGLVGCSPVM